MLPSSSRVLEAVRRAIEIYNRYRSPEAKASLEKLEDNAVVVRFTGSFCRTCGVRDWVEDLVYVLEDTGVEAELIGYIEPPGDGDYRVGVFRIRGVVGDGGSRREGYEDNRDTL